MAMKIIWSAKAAQGYDRIVRYLVSNWSDKEVKAFIRETTHFLALLSENPHILQKSPSKRNLYRGPINRLTILTYRIKPGQRIIELVNIRATRHKPLKE